MRISTETAVGLFIIAAVAVFLYMSYHVGSFRFDRIKYNTYTIYFNDVSGLTKKADVKIAGVKVGWVDAIELVNDGHQVKATLLVDRRYIVHADAYGIIRQEGFLGSRHLELIPGDPLLPPLSSGSMLTRPNKSPVTIDEMIGQFSEVATRMSSIMTTIDGAISDKDGTQALRTMVENLQESMKHLASFAGKLDRIIQDNETSLDTIVRDLRDAIPRLSENIQRNLDRVAGVLERDFDRMASQLEAGIAPIRETAQKINDGKGILGQLINDDLAYDDLRTAINGIKNYFDKIDKMRVVFDIHTESMCGPIERREMVRDSKSYVNLRLHTAEDYFYVVGLIASRNGTINRYDEERRWFEGGSCSSGCTELIPADLDLSDNKKLKYATLRSFKVRNLDKLLFNIQFGKIYGNFAFRFGLFDSTGGIGMDIDIPFGVADLRWVTTFEAFDFSGVNRYCDDDDRPHLKWLNRMFFTRNIYFTFGADDFISRFNKNVFFGVGIRFVDDDMKYLLSRVTVLAPT